ncbi:unnamed protein product [Ambrosiozyma monospora]|uniref:Unnamed protein product n=1 Tax=Ambrosiozyma monospora TaxID=43982 RepID=A0A9W6WKF0_AMBMO|nr:unnamed protein product [Ambrosiozyma monospora]
MGKEFFNEYEAPVSSSGASVDSYRNEPFLRRVVRSFERQKVDLSRFNLDEMTEEQRRHIILANQPLKRALNDRIMQMIAIGGTIGTGLFIGLGYSLASGPGALLIGFTIVGIAIYCVCQAAAELSVAYPVSGSFASHISRFIEPGLGFTIATNYALACLCCPYLYYHWYRYHLWWCPRK